MILTQFVTKMPFVLCDRTLEQRWGNPVLLTQVLGGPTECRCLPFLYHEPPAKIDTSYRFCEYSEAAQTD